MSKVSFRNIALTLIFAFTPLFLSTVQGQETTQGKVDKLLSRMTLEEKVGQMNQITLETVSKPRKDGSQTNELDLDKLREAIIKYNVGSILNTGGAANTAANWREMIIRIQDISLNETRLKIPNIYGIDAIHGANYIQEATLFPQSLAMASTWNVDLVKESAKITAEEVRAVGISWNFNPVLGLGRQPIWSRLWETFGEDVYACARFGEAYIKGMEGENNIPDIPQNRVAACMKHYLGYSFPLSGRDRTPAWIPDRMLRELFLVPFKAATDAGVHTLMVNSSEINGVPVHASHYYLTEILRDELGFKGFVVSDWEDVKNLYTREKVAKSQKDAVRLAVIAGMDMSMVPYDYSFYNHLIELVNEGAVPMERIDEAVGRILRVKFELGLFNEACPAKDNTGIIGSKESAQVSLEAARESVILLKNKKNILPLHKSQRILVAGPTADSRASLNSGWSYVWQGDEEARYPKEKKTILQAIQNTAGTKNVTYVKAVEIDKEIDIDAAVKAAKKVDKIILCLGEGAYCESPGSITNLNLPQAQIKLVESLAKTGKPIILVLIEGRPRIINNIVDSVDGILAAFLPGPEGGQAIADVLFGDVNPSGKLAITYPRHPNYLTCYDHKNSARITESKFQPQWPFGFGLSYTRFSYSDLTLSSSKLKDGEKLEITVTVKNIGKAAGKEAVHLFISDLVRSVTPPVKQLKGFKKIELDAGQEKRVTFEITSDALSFIGQENKRIVEPGVFKVSVGDLTKEFVFE